MRSNFAVLWKFKTYLDKRWVGGSKMFLFMLRVKNVHVELCRWSKRSKCCPPSCWMPFVRDCFLIIYPHLPRVDLYLIFEKFELEKSSSRNLTFSFFELDFYCLCSRCVACKNRFQNWFLQAVCWTGSFQMDFSKMKYWLLINRGLCWNKPPSHNERPFFKVWICLHFQIDSVHIRSVRWWPTGNPGAHTSPRVWISGSRVRSHHRCRYSVTTDTTNKQ